MRQVQGEPLKQCNIYRVSIILGNKYKVICGWGEGHEYLAVEQSDCCSKTYCGPLRSFNMPILDKNGQELLHIGNTC